MSVHVWKRKRNMGVLSGSKTILYAHTYCDMESGATKTARCFDLICIYYTP